MGKKHILGVPKAKHTGKCSNREIKRKEKTSTVPVFIIFLSSSL